VRHDVDIPEADDAPTYDPRTPLSRRLVTLARQIDCGAAPAYLIVIEDVAGETVDVHPASELERVETLLLAATADLQARGLVHLGDGLSAPSEVTDEP
jgi:hypothetical protein